MNLTQGRPAMKCGRWVIETVPRPGYGSSKCGGSGCRYDEGVWFFERKLGQVGAASISIPKSAGCCDCVPRKWRDELAFYREDANGDLDLEWIGPVVDVQDNNVDDVLTIFARDRSTWVLEENAIPQQIAGITEPAASRFRRIWNLVDQLDTTYLDLVRLGTSLGPLTSEDIGQWSTTLSQIGKLEGFGIYWTVVADEILYGDLASVAAGITLDPSVAWDGNGAIVSDVGATSISALVVVTKSGDLAVYPPNFEPDPCEGSHIRVIEPEFLLEGGEILAYAQSQYDVWSSQGLQIATSVDSSVSERWPIALTNMQPGMTFNIDTSAVEFCLNAETSAQLTSMTVEGRNCDETAIKVGLSPRTGVISNFGG